MKSATQLYLELMILTLTDLIYERSGTMSLNAVAFQPEVRENGFDWPVRAHTMIGVKRLRNILSCAESILENGVKGDFMETGVWRGGATIFMRAILEAYAEPSRSVWVADSFAGLPEPDAQSYPADANDRLYTETSLAVSLAEVQENFSRYGLLDERVRFVPGWFRETLSACPVEKLALLRLDGDMYESTIVALEALYPKLSVGGFVIIDDYALPACKQAVDDYRAQHDIRDQMQSIDWTGAYWKRTRS
jgi:O-methyltransferase